MRNDFIEQDEDFDPFFSDAWEGIKSGASYVWEGTKSVASDVYDYGVQTYAELTESEEERKAREWRENIPPPPKNPPEPSAQGLTQPTQNEFEKEREEKALKIRQANVKRITEENAKKRKKKIIIFSSIGGVLLIGGIVTYIVLKNKK
mgnify:CR=1 FL=1